MDFRIALVVFGPQAHAAAGDERAAVVARTCDRVCVFISRASVADDCLAVRVSDSVLGVHTGRVLQMLAGTRMHQCEGHAHIRQGKASGVKHNLAKLHAEGGEGEGAAVRVGTWRALLRIVAALSVTL